jgi:hypothetical protein
VGIEDSISKRQPAGAQPDQQTIIMLPGAGANTNNGARRGDVSRRYW